MTIDTLFLALFCGHLLGDFVVQTDWLARKKAEDKRFMILHVALVTLVSWLLLGNLAAWWLAAALFAVHLLIDALKLLLDAKLSASGQGGLASLALDQFLHLCSILALCHLSGATAASLPGNHWEALLGSDFRKGLVVLAGLAVTVPGIGVVLKFQMADFAVLLDPSRRQGLPRGGKTIGMLERFLVFLFVLAGKPEGAGFVIAAKSVFRIGELTKKEDRDHAEYIMIGTLRSFTYALAAAFATGWLLDRL